MKASAEKQAACVESLMALGSRLREIREGLIRKNPESWQEWTQVGVAQRVDHARGLISLAEHGRQRPSMLLLTRLMDLYECSDSDRGELLKLYESCPATPSSRHPHQPKSGRPRLPPHLRRTDSYFVRLRPDERRRLQRLSGVLDLKRDADVFREGLIALEEREARKAR